jgi:amidohydrolase
MRGTIRTFDPAVRTVVLEHFYQIVTDVAHALGCHAEIDVQSLTPALVNDPLVTARVLEIARARAEFSIENQFITMGSEDMAFILQQIPGCFFFIGSASHEKNLDAPHHHPKFDIDERSLPKAAGLLASATADFLK